MEPPQIAGLMADPVDGRQIFFTNLLLLDFDPVAAERKWRILFNKDMFALPNKKGSEVVLHHLFNKLNPVRCAELFRHCWPVTDKKVETLFRKTCNHWLAEIVKEDPNAHLPRIVASLFMSPGGEKFYQLLLCFSRYVLVEVMGAGQGPKDRQILQWVALTQRTRGMGGSIAAGIQCASIQQRKHFLKQTKANTIVQHHWKTYSSDLTREYRALCREVKDLERAVKTEVQRLAEMGASRSSPAVKPRSGFSHYDLDVQSVKRAERIQKVRGMWRSLEGFLESSHKLRDILESMFEGSNKKYKLDAADLNVRIPDQLLRECEKEIQRRNVDNIYTGGKLNLLSLIHLWNLSLHLYIEKLHQAGLGTFEEHTPQVTAHLHTHQAHLANVQSLRSRLSKEVMPDLKDSISTLKSHLDQAVLEPMSPESIRSTSLGLGLLPPTPPVNFSTEDVEDMRNDLLNQHIQQVDGALAGVSTPEAASQLMDLVNKKVRRKQPSGLVQGSPLYAPRLANDGKPSATNCFPPSNIPVTKQAPDNSRPRSRIRSAPAAALPETSTRGTRGRRVKVTGSGTTLEEGTPKELGVAKNSILAQKQTTTDNEVFKPPQSSTRKNKTRQKSSSKRVPHRSGLAGSEGSVADPHDILADRLVESLLTATPRRIPEVASELPPPPSPYSITAQLGGEAFQVRDKLARTPATERPSRSRPQDSIGPLTSTRIEGSSRSGSERGGSVHGRDKLAQRLFTDDMTDSESVDMPSQKGSSNNSTLQASFSGPASSQNSTLRHSSEDASTSHSAGNTSHNDADDEDADVDAVVQMIVDENSPLSDTSPATMATWQQPPDPGLQGNVELSSTTQPVPSSPHLRNVSSPTNRSIHHGLHRANTSPKNTLSPQDRLSYSIPDTIDIPNHNKSLEEMLRLNTTSYAELFEMPTPTLPSRKTDLRHGRKPPTGLRNTSDIVESPKSRHQTPCMDRVYDMNNSERLGAYGKEKGDDKENNPPGLIQSANISDRLLDLDSEEDDLDLLNTSGARVIELENGEFSECIEVSPGKQRPVLQNGVHCHEEPPLEKSSTDLDRSTLDSLLARFQRLKSGGIILETNSHLQSKSPVTSWSTSDHSQSWNIDRPAAHQSPKPCKEASPVLDEQYLVRTPVKERPKFFTLDFDDDMQPDSSEGDRLNVDGAGPSTTKASGTAPILSLASISMSPLTDTLHREPREHTGSSARRLHLDDMLDVDESILLPSSPPMFHAPSFQPSRNSPAVGKLLDL